MWNRGVGTVSAFIEHLLGAEDGWAVAGAGGWSLLVCRAWLGHLLGLRAGWGRTGPRKRAVGLSGHSKAEVGVFASWGDWYKGRGRGSLKQQT